MSTDSITAEPEFMPANTTTTSDKPKRFHPALVTLHWLIAILIFGAFFLVQGGEGDRGRFRPGQGRVISNRKYRDRALNKEISRNRNFHRAVSLNRVVELRVSFQPLAFT